MVFQRPRKQILFMYLNFAVTAACGVYFLNLAQTSNLKYDWFFGCLFVLWSAYILYNITFRHASVRLEADGLEIKRMKGPVWVAWEALQWARVTLDGRILFFAYQNAGDAKDRYVGVSRRALSDEAVNTIRDALYDARPNLPDADPSAKPSNAQPNREVE